eukprot:gnl/TRDRNA2_/TRDRNA2_39468_c0_seq1.p1 gnl/TRDRNA2_/TRDRNA2_39468_c0~~gnl/TRDRNA2_/TRDRNA2_39468_c0_seq1.p1  ORF type:complete len:273 (+),score=59.13 gnl/TRDRNA2_/TRDRNA2_39468_c0_seq1:110-928(+)
MASTPLDKATAATSVDQFLKVNGIEDQAKTGDDISMRAAASLRDCRLDVQQRVIELGPLYTARNRAAALLGRIKECRAELNAIVASRGRAVPAASPPPDLPRAPLLPDLGLRKSPFSLGTVAPIGELNGLSSVAQQANLQVTYVPVQGFSGGAGRGTKARSSCSRSGSSCSSTSAKPAKKKKQKRSRSRSRRKKKSRSRSKRKKRSRSRSRSTSSKKKRKKKKHRSRSSSSSSQSKKSRSRSKKKRSRSKAKQKNGRGKSRGRRRKKSRSTS